MDQKGLTGNDRAANCEVKSSSYHSLRGSLSISFDKFKVFKDTKELSVNKKSKVNNQGQ